jgi:succinyl-CoA synthetase beta subunit
MTFRPEKIPNLVKNMLGNRLITKQTPKKGVPVHQIMVAESVDIFEEKYLCFLLDR